MKAPLYLENRINDVLHLLNIHSRVSTAELCSHLHIAPSTARKLLADMEKEGLLIRTYGGAISVDANKDLSLTQKMLLNIERKRKIAQCARNYVKDGDHIAIGGGSTLLEFCSCLLNLKGAAVVTDSISCANILMQNPNIEVQICTGTISSRTGCIVGASAIRSFNDMVFDKVFLGIDGVDLEQGFWYDNILIGNVERSMTHAARQVFILADSTKMGHTSIVPMLPLEAADYIITNPFYDTRFIQRLKRHGCNVIFSEEPEDY